MFLVPSVIIIMPKRYFDRYKMRSISRVLQVLSVKQERVNDRLQMQAKT